MAREIHRSGTAVVSGIAAYEGPAGHDRSAGTLASVSSYLESVTGIFRDFHDAGVFPADDPPVLTIGGSDIFELVSGYIQHELASVDPYRLVIRSGCYLVHITATTPRSGPASSPAGRWAYTPFEAALEVGATVVSRPQTDLALLNVGRRDIGFDMGAPSVIDPLPADGSGPLPIVKLNDQHAFVHPDESTFLPVGTPVRVGISHPCTALDKWRVLLAVDDDYNVVDTATTIF